MFCLENKAVRGKPIPVMVSTCKQLWEAGLAECLQPFMDTVVSGLQLLTPPATIEQQLLSPELPSLLQTSWSAAMHLFKLLDQLYSVFPKREYTAELAAVKQACSMQLSTATFQNLSRCLEHMPPQLSSPPKIVTDLLDWTCRSGRLDADKWYHTNGDRAKSDSYRQLLSMQQQCLPCVAIMLLALTYATLLQDEAQAAEAVPSRAADAWQLACSYEDGARASHHELLQLLGGSSRALLYAACTLSLEPVHRVRSIRATVALYSDMLRASMLHEQSAEQQRLSYALALLLPTVMLLWRTEYPSARLHFSSVLACAAQAAHIGWVWLAEQLLVLVSPEERVPVYGSSQPKQRRQQGRQRKQGKKGRQDAQPSQDGLEQQDVQASGQQPAIEVPRSLGAWLASLDPAAVTDSLALSEKLLRRVLQESGGSCSPVSIDHAGSSSRGAGMHGSGSARADLIETSQSFEFMVFGIHSLDEVYSIAAAAQQQDTDTGTGLASHVRATWAAHAGELYGVIDDHVRWQADKVQLQLLPRPVFPLELYLLFGEGPAPSILQAAVAAAGPGGNRQLWSLAVTLFKTAEQQDSRTARQHQLGQPSGATSQRSWTQCCSSHRRHRCRHSTAAAKVAARTPAVVQQQQCLLVLQMRVLPCRGWCWLDIDLESGCSTSVSSCVQPLS